MNSLATLVAYVYLPRWYPDFIEKLGVWSYFVYAIAGVLLFEGLLANTNIRLFNQGVLAFQDWATKAKVPAAGAAIRKQARLDGARHREIARELSQKVPEDQLDTHLLHNCGVDEFRRLEEHAEQHDIDRKYHKAFELASRFPNEAEGILEDVRRERHRDSLGEA